MLLLEVLVGGMDLLILAAVLILSLEVLVASLRRENAPPLTHPRPRLAVIIPAHDEAAGIRSTLQSLAPQLQSGDELLVIADNCTDDTAVIASSAGAEVIVRDDPARRGKGYALDFGMRHLERNPPEVVVIVDADCRLEEGSLDRLARVCAQAHRPVQALNLSHAPEGAGVKMRVAEFASTLKNRIRPLGLHRLGLPCHLTGTGMAFPWACISRATLATGHIVEDLKLGLELASSGYPPLFCPAARVSSCFPASEEGFKSQRARWEHGYLGVLVKDVPAVLLKSVATANGSLLALGLDLCVPPIALLTLLGAAAWVASGFLYGLWRAELPLLMASAAAALLAASILASWIRYGRQILSFRDLTLALLYALWKAPLYARFLAGRKAGWVRTKRDADRSA